MKGGIIGLIGLQGVGKSSALTALYKRYIDAHDSKEIILFKWRRKQELFNNLLIGTHEASQHFRDEYADILLKELRFRFPDEELPANHYGLSIDAAEKELGSSISRKLREKAWFSLLCKRHVVLIDTPDYSKTDRRAMATDLQEIYWLWSNLAESNWPPTIVIAIQKEMFHDHFFLDKMHKVELKPLKSEQMCEAYKRRFKTLEPFTDEGLQTLGRVSRGIFRRFLRYVGLSIDRWERQPEPRRPIDPAAVRQAVTVEQLMEDMELELSEIFPKQSELKRQAVRVMFHLTEKGPQTQTRLAEELDVEEYTLTRLLQKLELHNYVVRERAGLEKIVRFRE
jgi:hypothetical protein